MASKLALAAIWAYRKWLSPLKGWNCASGALHGHQTCSAAGLRIFKKAGLLRGMKLLRRQLDRCAMAAHELGMLGQARMERSAVALEAKPAQVAYLGVKALAARAGSRRSQAGFIDGCDAGGCDGCDAPSCDLPDVNCEMPSCEMPSFPSCEMPGMPSCGLPKMPSFTACEAPLSGGGSGGAAAPWWEIAYCADSGCGTCDGGRGTAQEKAAKARGRQGQDQAKRDARRPNGEALQEGEDGADDGARS